MKKRSFWLVPAYSTPHLCAPTTSAVSIQYISTNLQPRHPGLQNPRPLLRAQTPTHHPSTLPSPSPSPVPPPSRPRSVDVYCSATLFPTTHLRKHPHSPSVSLSFQAPHLQTASPHHHGDPRSFDFISAVGEIVKRPGHTCASVRPPPAHPRLCRVGAWVAFFEVGRVGFGSDSLASVVDWDSGWFGVRGRGRGEGDFLFLFFFFRKKRRALKELRSGGRCVVSAPLFLFQEILACEEGVHE